MDQILDFLFDEWALSIAFLFVTTLIARSFLEPVLSGVKNVKPQEAVRLINDDNTVVLDVRLENEFNNGHILNSLHIPVGALDSRIKELESHKNGTIVLNCQTGARSKQAASILKKHGFTSMYSIEGGINAWVNANLPLNKGGKRKQKK